MLHLLLPAGERWFIHVYRQVLPYIHDEQLRQDVIGFIGQEAVHSQAHDDVLPRLRQLGLDPTPYTAQVDWFGLPGPFEVELHRSGRTVRVAAGQSVLAAVREELPYVSYSCEQGFCGTCQQRVLEGEIDHRDELLTDSERDGSMLICVSRCRGERLVLDL